MIIQCHDGLTAALRTGWRGQQLDEGLDEDLLDLTVELTSTATIDCVSWSENSFFAATALICPCSLRKLDNGAAFSPQEFTDSMNSMLLLIHWLDELNASPYSRTGICELQWPNELQWLTWWTRHRTGIATMVRAKFDDNGAPVTPCQPPPLLWLYLMLYNVSYAIRLCLFS